MRAKIAASRFRSAVVAGGLEVAAPGLQVVEVSLDRAGFEHQPEGFGARGLEVKLHQLGREIGAGVLGYLAADFVGEEQQRAVGVMGCGKGIHPVDEIGQVGLALGFGRQAGLQQVFPAGVVVAHRQRHPPEGLEALEQRIAHLAMHLGAVPVELPD